MKIEIPESLKDSHKSRQDHYCNMVLKGEGHRFAEMCALQRPPRAMTDRELFQGIGNLGKQFDGEEFNLRNLVRAARRNGYEPGTNDVYNPGLARFFGDPEGFIPPTGGRGHIQKVCEERGVACYGAVNVKGRSPDAEPEKIKLGEDIIQAKTQEYLSKNPDMKTKDRKELRERIIDTHGNKAN